MGWYLSRGWKTNRDAAAKAASGVCARCGETARIEVHHIADPFPNRDVELLLRLDNVEVICVPCHRREHNDQGASTPCEVCSTTVKHNPSQRARRFCSITCRDKHPDFARREDRTCIICGALFYPKQAATACCSQACAAKRTAQVRREKREAPHG